MPVTKALRLVAVGTVGLFGFAGALFIAGEGLSDPGGLEGIGLTASWAVPMAVLVLTALRRPALGARVLPWALALVAALVLLDVSASLLDRSGPGATIAMFVVAVPCGLLGLHRATEAGMLVLVAAMLQLLATVAAHTRQRSGGPGPSLGDALTGSTGVLVVPLFVLAALLILTAVLERHDARHPHVRALT